MKKKVNQNRIPIGKDSVQTAEILQEASNRMTFHTWALLLSAMSDYRDSTTESLYAFWVTVDHYPTKISNRSDVKQALQRIQQSTGVVMPVVPVLPTDIKTQGDLNRYKKKTLENAFAVSLAILTEPLADSTILAADRFPTILRKIMTMHEEISNEVLSEQEILDTLRDECGLILEQDNNRTMLRRTTN